MVCQKGRHALGLSEGEQGARRAQEIRNRTEQLKEMGQMRWNVGSFDTPLYWVLSIKGSKMKGLGQVVALAKSYF